MPDTASSFDAAGKLARLFMCLACLTIVFLICPIDCQGCSAGSFGPHCNYSCSNCYDTARCLNFNNLTGGCSDQICTKGFANPPLCQIPCGTGIYMDRFGFNCSFRCHCNGSTGCDPVSGNCNSGCHPAWIGPGCQTQLPKMSQPPNITGNDCSGLTVSFLRFNSSVDEGVDSVEFYRLQTDNGTNDVLWYIVQDFLQVVADPYKVTLPFESLNASYSYRFRVIAKFKDPFFTNFFGPASPPSSAVKPVCVPTPGVPPMGSFAVAVVGSGLRATWNASLTPTIVNYNITVTPLRTGDCANLTGPVTNRLVPVGEQVFNYSGEPWTTYQVSAFSTTRLGEVSPTVTSSYITDPAKPITPVTIRLLGKGTDWLNFTWSPPSCSERRGLIQQYQYYVFEISGSDSLVKSKDTPATVQEVPLSNLTPFTTYNISVNYITLGTSPDAVLSVTTDAALGPDPPTNINVASITSTSATISWSPPTAPKAPIADYIVKVISPVSITHIATGVSVELVNLTSATAYTVQVHSRSINGSVGLASTSTIFTTLASPQQVASLENSSRSSSTIILSWSAPSDTANLAQFRIVYTLLESKAPGVSAGASSTINETAAARTRSVTGLQPASHYTLCVTPVYNSSTSGVQRCNNAWTTPGVFAAPPAAPALLGAAGVTSANISLTAAATYTGGPLTAYVLGLQLTSSSPGRRRRRAVAPGSVDLAGYTIIAEFSPVGLPAAFLIGDGRSYGGYANPGLSPSSVYNVRLAAYSLVDGVYASAASSPLAISSLAAPAASTAAPTPAGSSSNNTGLIVGLVILFIILLAAIAVGLYFYISRVLRPNSACDLSCQLQELSPSTMLTLSNCSLAGFGSEPSVTSVADEMRNLAAASLIVLVDTSEIGSVQ